MDNTLEIVHGFLHSKFQPHTEIAPIFGLLTQEEVFKLVKIENRRDAKAGHIQKRVLCKYGQITCRAYFFRPGCLHCDEVFQALVWRQV